MEIFPILALGAPTVAARQYNHIMKKFLEVLVDEDGKFHFSTEEEFVSEEAFAVENPRAKVEHAKEIDKLLKRPVHDMTEFMWQNQEQKVSQAVRLVAMAEILGCAQPYEHAEEFWSLMMFHTIPQFEKFAAAIKKPYGFDDRAVTRPIVGGAWAGGSNTMLFPLGQTLGKMGN